MTSPHGGPGRPAGPPLTPRATATGARRWLWLGAGMLAFGVGTLGIVLPVLPTTGFYIVAAACFARSSPRAEAWLLRLPRVGPGIRSYREGLGMPRRAKVVAIATLVVAVSLSTVWSSSWLWRLAVLALGAVGVLYIVLRVPTREVVEARRRAAGPR